MADRAEPLLEGVEGERSPVLEVRFPASEEPRDDPPNNWDGGEG